MKDVTLDVNILSWRLGDNEVAGCYVKYLLLRKVLLTDFFSDVSLLLTYCGLPSRAPR